MVLWAFLIYAGIVIMFGQPMTSHVVYKDPEPIATTTPKIVAVASTTKKHVVYKTVSKTDPRKDELKQVAITEAQNYGINPDTFVYIIKCESNFNSEASHDGGNGKGVTGFWKQTFDRWNNKFFNGELDYHKQEDQIKLMARAFQAGEEYRNDWSSWNKLQKYGTCYNHEIRKLANKKS